MASLLLTTLTTATALAQSEPTPPPADTTPQYANPLEAEAKAEEAAKEKAKEPKRGDFDAGGQVRLPSGPDEAGEFAAFNWIAVDLEGRYFLLDSVSVNANVPLAVKRPDTVGPMGAEPSLFGGMSLRFDANLPSSMKLPILRAQAGIALTLAYMREGAMLLSDKDYPLFVGDLQPGVATALILKTRLSSLLDLSVLPAFVFQKGELENLTALQLPVALIVKLGDLLKVSADVAIYTGDDFSFGASDGGRLGLGAAVDVKLGPILLHLGSGVASLITDEMGPYPTIKDSIYVDVNVKYAK